MKYLVAEGGGYELKVWPADDDAGPDFRFFFEAHDNNNHIGVSVPVTAAQLYAFMEWVGTWLPDPRKAEGEGGE